MRRIAWVVLLAAACGGKQAAKDAAAEQKPVAKNEPPAAQKPLAMKDVPTDYFLESGDTVAELLMPPPAGWKDLSDYPRSIEWQSPAGSTIHIELLVNGSPKCTLQAADADAVFGDAIRGFCTNLIPDVIHDERLTWTVDITPSKVKLADIAKVEIGFTATNPTQTTVDAHHAPLAIQIDGQSSQEIDMAFGNGGIGGEWAKLEPGKSADDSRSGLEWVTTAGDHEVTLLRLDKVLAHATLHVTK